MHMRTHFKGSIEETQFPIAWTAKILKREGESLFSSVDLEDESTVHRNDLVGQLEGMTP
jgi:hypothetical protein